jgi:NADPH:quinone reductase-like Zn-dependent oxidoreductase
VVHRAGSYDHLSIETSEVPVPGADEALVSDWAAGVNYADVVVRMGLYRSAREFVGWPITSGFEGAGVVESVGGRVEGVQVVTKSSPSHGSADARAP